MISVRGDSDTLPTTYGHMSYLLIKECKSTTIRSNHRPTGDLIPCHYRGLSYPSTGGIPTLLSVGSPPARTKTVGYLGHKFRCQHLIHELAASITTTNSGRETAPRTTRHANVECENRGAYAYQSATEKKPLSVVPRTDCGIIPPPRNACQVLTISPRHPPLHPLARHNRARTQSTPYRHSNATFEEISLAPPEGPIVTRVPARTSPRGTTVVLTITPRRNNALLSRRNGRHRCGAIRQEKHQPARSQEPGPSDTNDLQKYR
jgi:hypothetical protein